MGRSLGGNPSPLPLPPDGALLRDITEDAGFPGPASSFFLGQADPRAPSQMTLNTASRISEPNTEPTAPPAPLEETDSKAPIAPGMTWVSLFSRRTAPAPFAKANRIAAGQPHVAPRDRGARRRGGW